MPNLFRTIRLLVSVLLAGTLAAAHAQQPWPTRPITLVVTFAPGGTTDLAARLVAAKLHNELGQPVIVENRAGAGGSVGAATVAKAAPDGYTLMMAVSSHAINAKLFKNLPFELQRDFIGVGQITAQSLVIVVSKDFPAKTFPEFLAYLRDNRGPVNYGSAGVGTSYHLAGAWLNSLAAGKMVHVAYKGGAPVTQAILGGEIQVLIGTITELLPHIRSGGVRAMAVTAGQRIAQLPDVPAASEVLPGYVLTTWSGLLAPARTPAAVVSRLNGALAKVLQDPEVQKSIAATGSEIVGGTPQAFMGLVSSEVDKAETLVKISGVTLE